MEESRKKKLTEQKVDKTNINLFSKRYEQALGAPHFLAYLLYIVVASWH